LFEFLQCRADAAKPRIKEEDIYQSLVKDISKHCEDTHAETADAWHKGLLAYFATSGGLKQDRPPPQTTFCGGGTMAKQNGGVLHAE
jgi:hypothetical protein